MSLCVIDNIGTVGSFGTGTIAACFRRVEKICRDKLRLKIVLRSGTNVSPQSSIIKTGMSSTPTD
jgi:hypothetical protein